MRMSNSTLALTGVTNSVQRILLKEIFPSKWFIYCTVFHFYAPDFTPANGTLNFR